MGWHKILNISDQKKYDSDENGEATLVMLFFQEWKTQLWQQGKNSFFDLVYRFITIAYGMSTAFSEIECLSFLWSGFLYMQDFTLYVREV